MAKNVYALTENERKACTVLSKLKYRIEPDYFTVYCKCAENDQILMEAKKLLDGGDPIRFIEDVMIGLYGVFDTRTLGDYNYHK